MIIETPDGLVLVDFKTDRVKTGQIHERANLYAKQLKLYAKAAAKILNKKVDRSYLYFTNPATAVKIED